jgi:predicted site-specific integrase-resolvase
MRKAVELSGMCEKTLRLYADTGRIKCVKRGKHRYFDSDEFTSPNRSWGETPIICYCRVSSQKQHDDLLRQVASLRSQFPSAQIIQDVGSGLNFKRKGLQTILQRCLQGDKFTLVVAHRDRLCRFGFELIEFLINQNGGEIMVLNKPNDASPHSELVDDILAIIHVFSCRINGLRKYSDKIKEDKDLSQ